MASYFSRDYSVGAFICSSFSTGDSYGKGDVCSSTTHISSQKVDCWIDGGDFLSSQNRYYTSMIHVNKYISFSSLSMKRDDIFCTDGDVRGGFGHRITHLSSQKFDLSTYKHDGEFRPSQHHCTAPPMAPTLIRGLLI